LSQSSLPPVCKFIQWLSEHFRRCYQATLEKTRNNLSLVEMQLEPKTKMSVSPIKIGLPALSLRMVIVLCYLSISLGVRCEGLGRNEDIVSFFRQAIISPPDVEEFIVGQRELQSSIAPTNSYVYFKGARAGTNFYLWTFTNTNADFGTNARAIIVGRSGATPYSVNGKLAVYGFGSNSFIENVKWEYGKIRYFLAMGIGDLVENSIKWHDNYLTATNNKGMPRYGKLVISNGLPSKLEFSKSEDSPPFKIIEYTYPVPEAVYSGYPEKIVMSSDQNGDFKPVVEMVFQSVKLAAHPLTEDFFDPRNLAYRFQYTNVYSNSDHYVSALNNKHLVKVSESLAKTGGYTNSRPKFVIIICFVVVTLLPVAILLIRSTKTKKTKQKTYEST
jgi:hypothetical protein